MTLTRAGHLGLSVGKLGVLRGIEVVFYLVPRCVDNFKSKKGKSGGKNAKAKGSCFNCGK